MKRYLIYVVLLVMSVLPAFADSAADLPSLKTKVKTVAVFKNGLGFIYRSGETQVKDGWARMDAIPQAALGTLWFGSKDSKNPVEQVISLNEDMKKDFPAVSIVELLKANIGKNVNLMLLKSANSDAMTINGKILAVPEDNRNEELGLVTNRNTGGYYMQSQPQLVLFESAEKSISAISLSQIAGMQGQNAVLTFSDPDFNTKYSYKYKSPTAKIKMKNKNDKADVTFAYLEKGLTWSPGYLLNIQDPKNADITMEAVLANDVEDLDDVEVSFAVGYPNFMFADNISSLYIQQSVNDFIQRLGDGMAAARRSMGVMSQSTSNYANYYSDSRSDSFNPASTYSVQNMQGESNEDLYLYKQEHVTLPKGSRARYTIFTDNIPYEHIYKYEVSDTSRTDPYHNYDNQNQKKIPDQVWHCLRVKNTSKQPWTTAPCFVVNGSTPVAQDTLQYTPPGAKNTVKLTVAVDIRAEQEQNEKSRKGIDINGSSHTEIEIAGKITLTNTKSTKTKMNVIKQINGVVLGSDNNAKSTTQIEVLNSLNPNAKLEWEFDLEPGQSKELNFTYKTII